MKNGFLAIVREKINNDLAVYDQMIVNMVKEGTISNPEEAKIEISDLLREINKCTKTR